MNLFNVHQEKCTKCGNCAAACPRSLIELKEKKFSGFPFPIHGSDEDCINCGHCVVVCPHDALTHRTMAPDQCPRLQEERLPPSPQVEHLLRYRRSVRAYQDKPVERELLEKLIDIARYAPSGHNSQPVHWLIIYDKNEVKRILEKVVAWARFARKKFPDVAKALFIERSLEDYDSGKDSFLRNAPHIIVAHSSKGDTSAKTSCTIAMTYLQLAAFSNGLATCWDRYIMSAISSWPPLKNAIDLPQGHIIYEAMLIGYPKYKFYRLPHRNQPKITWR
jgi:nitroreductase/NAD-dependent dihydropyrimidine dehydrogenase PreA subunit